MHTDPDTQLMLAVKAGDQAAFQRLFDRYKARVINFCFRFCGSRAVAEELAQETFLRVYKAAPRYRPSAAFKTWLYKIATNVCLNEMRRPMYRAKTESLDQTDESGDVRLNRLPAHDAHNRPDAVVESAERNGLVMSALKRLPEPQRAALLLRIHEAFSYREIGRQINRSESQVKTLIHRGRQRLKSLLHNYGDIPS